MLLYLMLCSIIDVYILYIYIYVIIQDFFKMRLLCYYDCYIDAVLYIYTKSKIEHIKNLIGK